MPIIGHGLRSDLLTSALDNAAFGVALYEGEDFVHVYVNPAFQALKPHRPMLGRSYADIWPEVAEITVPQLRQVLETGEPWVAANAPFEIEREPGVMETAYYTFSVLRPEIGDHRYLLEYAVETTAEVKAQRGELLASLLANMSDGFMTLDPDWRFTSVNDRAAQALRASKDEVLGRTLWEAFPDLVGSPLEDRFRHAMDAGVKDSFEAHYARYDAWVDVRVNPHGDGLAIFQTDVTERKRAEQRAQQELATTRQLLDAADALASRMSLAEVLDALCDAVLGVFMHERVTVTLWHEEDRSLEVAAARGEPAVPVGLTTGWDEMTEATRRAFIEQQPVLIDFDALPPGARGIAERVGTHLVLAVPLVYRGRILGLLAVDDPLGRRTFTEREIEIARGIASQASVAIENARLFESERRSARIAATLNGINEILLSTLTVDEMLERVVVDSSRAVGADRALVVNLEGDAVLVRHVHGFPPELVGKRFPLSAFPAMARTFATGEPQLVDEAATSPDIRALVAAENRIASFVTLPLQAAGKLLGALMYAYVTPQHFDEHDAEFAERLSVALSLALESARHFEEERDIADRLQEALLTLPESLSGIEFAHAYHSATEAARVGGDFYDLFELNHHHVGITIGDVAGKGLDAAVLTSLAKNTVRAHATEKGKTPSRILALANDVVFRATPTESFVTVFFGILDRRDGRLVYASAGHTAAAIIRDDGRVDELRLHGPLLGAFSEVGFEDAEVRLGPDELLFLYTDGLTEARRKGEQYGEERLFGLLAGMMARSPGDVVRDVVADVIAFTGNRLRDDLAILALRQVERGSAMPMQQKLEM